MRRSDLLRAAQGVCVYLAGCFLAGLIATSCTGYFAPGGASLYCKDRDGKAIHCPDTPKADSTRADTSRKGEG